MNKGTLALATYNGSSNVEAVFIDQDQKIGIGTNTPQNKLDVTGGMAMGAYGGSNAAPSNSLIVSGKIGIGTASPQNALDVNGGVAVGGYAGSDAAPDSGLIVSGDVGIGTNSPSYKLQLGSGDACKPTGGSWQSPSDSKLKKDIKPFRDGMNILAKINPIKYKLNGKAGLPKNQEGIGVLAEKVKSVAPYMIKPWIHRPIDPKTRKKGKTEKYLAFDASALTFILINAVKEQQNQIKQLQAQVNRMRLPGKK